MISLEKILVNTLKVGVYAVLLTVFIYFPTQIFVFQSLVEILFAAYLNLAIFYRQYRPKLNSIFFSYAFLLATLLLTTFTGTDWRISFWSFPHRSIGVFALLHFFALFLILRGLGPNFNWKKYLTAAFFISLIAATLGSRFMGNQNFLSAYLLLNAFLGLWLIYQYPQKILRLLLGLGVGYNIVAIFLTQTRGVILGLFFGLTVFFAIRKYKLIVMFLIALVLVAALTIQLPLWQKIPGVKRFAGKSLAELGVAPRLAAWQFAWEGIKENPFLGWGWENFEQVVNKNYQPNLGSEEFFSKPHNIFLEYLISGGALLFLAFLLLLVSYFRKLLIFKKEQPVFTAAFCSLMIGYLIQNFFSFDTFSSYLMLSVVLAVVSSKASEEQGGALIDFPDTKKASLFLAVALLISAALSYQVNFKSWRADYRAGGPYKDFLVKDFINSLPQEAPAEKVDWALKKLAEAIDRHPHHYFFRFAYADAATAFSQLNEDYLAEAKKQIDAAIQLSPNRPKSYYVLSRILLAQKKEKEAIKAMERVLALDPKNSLSHFYMSHLLFKLNLTNEAVLELVVADQLGWEIGRAHV